jgi:hypothetical protein
MIVVMMSPRFFRSPLGDREGAAISLGGCVVGQVRTCDHRGEEETTPRTTTITFTSSTSGEEGA